MKGDHLSSRLGRSLDDLIDYDRSSRSLKAPRGRTITSARAQPYERERPRGRNDQEDLDPVFETPTNSVKVAATSDVRELASTIVHSSRGSDIPTLLTIGNQSINQAVKGIAAARADLQEDPQDLMFQPAFRHPDRNRPLIAFYLTRQRPGREDTRVEEVELTVAAGSKIHAIAGAIAGKIREGKRVSTVAIGVDAVTNAVLAVGNARLYLEEDNLDIKVMPEFIRVTKGAETRNAMKFKIQAETI